MRDHRKLQAFDLAHAFTLSVYRETKQFPREEQYGLTSQFRRAAVSVAANIVEGCARSTQNEYVRFLDIAFGSLREAGYYIKLARDLGYLNDESAKTLSDEYNHCARVLAGLIAGLRRQA